MGGRFVLGALAALALCAVAPPAAAACKLDGLLELPVTMYGLRPTIEAKIEGKDARLIADTGGYGSLMSDQAAKRLGLKPAPASSSRWVIGATGMAQVHVVRAKEMTLRGPPIRDVDFVVAGDFGTGVDGAIGQDFLNEADGEFDIGAGAIRLFRTDGCADAPLAYWDKTGGYSEVDMTVLSRQIGSSAVVNGVKIQVVFDSGSPRSTLTLAAARRVGASPDGPDAVSAGVTSGIGGQAAGTWLVPVKSFAIGGEEIKNTRLRVADLRLTNIDMILGADFFLSHRMFFARAQRKIYFTYNGGPVFRLDRADAAGPSPAPASAPVDAQAATAPAAPEELKDAAAYGRRASAFAARGQLAQALKDYDRAVELDPKNPQRYYDRAGARAAAGRTALALEDMDTTLKLKPDFPGGRFGRAALRVETQDLAGARADFEAVAAQETGAHIKAAEVYVGAGLYREAAEQYDAWIKANPKAVGRFWALNGRCWTRAVGNFELEQGLADCEAAMKISRNWVVLGSRGLMRLRLGRHDDAIADFDAALKQQPKSAWSLYGRGLARLRNGLKAEGEADLKAAAAADGKTLELAKAAGLTP